ncbi:MAG TPA: hypothetical protein VFF04_04730 [Candidatus Babeliales bacterium]|nr:hypothetical protein [Candidatus Babeliales bacterium]
MKHIAKALSLACLFSIPTMQADYKKYLWHIPAMAVILSNLDYANGYRNSQNIDSLAKIDNKMIRTLSIATMAAVYAYQHLCQANPAPVQSCKCCEKLSQNKLTITQNPTPTPLPAAATPTAPTKTETALSATANPASAAPQTVTSETKRKLID